MRGRGSTTGVRVAWRWRVVPAVLGAVLLAGCTAERPESSEPTAPVEEVTETPTPTATPVVVPERPATMDEPTTDGAIAAATYFLQLYDYAFASGDTNPLMAMSGESCDLCTYVHDSVASMVSEGLTSVGPPSMVASSEATEIRPDEWFSALLRVEQGATQEVDATGKVVADSPANVTDFLFAISWLGDRWRVEAVDLTEVVE